jgi:hypothetical protein
VSISGPGRPGPGQAGRRGIDLIVADQLVMLRDGAMVSGYLSDPSAVADALGNTGRAVIAFNTA